MIFSTKCWELPCDKLSYLLYKDTLKFLMYQLAMETYALAPQSNSGTKRPDNPGLALCLHSADCMVWMSLQSNNSRLLNYNNGAGQHIRVLYVVQVLNSKMTIAIGRLTRSTKVWYFRYFRTIVSTALLVQADTLTSLKCGPGRIDWRNLFYPFFVASMLYIANSDFESVYFFSLFEEIQREESG